MKTLRLATGSALILALVVTVLGPLETAVAEASSTSAEQRFIDHINGERQNRGLAPFQVNTGLRKVARGWSSTMSYRNSLHHNPDLATQVSNNIDGDWTRLAENVGMTRSTGASWSQLVDRLHAALMNSDGHRANMLGRYNQVGVGVTIAADGTLWVTQVFIQGNATNVVSTERSKSAVPIAGDWNGDGQVTAGWFDNGRVFLRNANSAGAPDVAFNFGRGGDVPVVGDWNGDGRTTVGVRRGGTWYLSNRNAAGAPAATFNYGRSGDVPVVGDWNGDGRTTVGVRRDGTWYLSNRNAAGAPAATFHYGRSGDVPVHGDWNRNHQTTPGVVRGTTWYLRNHLSAGSPSNTFAF